MPQVNWEIRAREFVNCNCAYGCPCQFNALPTHGDCKAVTAFEIDSGHHGQTKLDGLRVALVFAWPGPIHLGKGEVVPIIDKRATPAQRDALLRIVSGKDTEPGATIFQVFSTTFEKVHDPVFADIELQVDIDARRAHLKVPGYIDTRGEPIVNPVTGKEHRARIDMPNGFEYHLAEMGRGWTKTTGPISLDLANTYGAFAKLNLTQSGVVD
jgi:hypothetical protein